MLLQEIIICAVVAVADATTTATAAAAAATTASRMMTMNMIVIVVAIRSRVGRRAVAVVAVIVISIDIHTRSNFAAISKVIDIVLSLAKDISVHGLSIIEGCLGQFDTKTFLLWTFSSNF